MFNAFWIRQIKQSGFTVYADICLAHTSSLSVDTNILSSHTSSRISLFQSRLVPAAFL